MIKVVILGNSKIFRQWKLRERFFSTKYDLVILRKFCGWKERVSTRTAPLAFENILAEKII